MSIIKQIEPLIQVNDGMRYVVRWETSYNYTTKTSRRSGGYDRTRTSIYFYDESGWSKDKRIDALTGKFCSVDDYEIWLVPIPDFFFDHSDYEFWVKDERKYQWGNKIYPVEKLKYCQYGGKKESAEYLASYNTKNKLRKYTLKDESFDGFGFCLFDLFFPQQSIAESYNPYTTIDFLDGEKTKESLHEYSPDKTRNKLVLVPKETQLSLF
jgi:hypothetical protein